VEHVRRFAQWGAEAARRQAAEAGTTTDAGTFLGYSSSCKTLHMDGMAECKRNRLPLG
jgi:hypothetical protein